MRHLIYLSSATEQFDREDLEGLLVQSRRRNQRLGVTGVLVYKDGTFFQVMEGEKPDLDLIYADICVDPRYRGVLTLFYEEIPDREFPDWSMAFYDAELSPDIREGFNDLLNQQSPEERIDDLPVKVRAFVRHLVR